ncbi:MAG: hypothetical protein Q9M37_01635 [Desulfonauticus sp.]|nr:hypothetical protein [Desulfonauticus sp.]
MKNSLSWVLFFSLGLIFLGSVYYFCSEYSKFKHAQYVQQERSMCLSSLKRDLRKLNLEIEKIKEWDNVLSEAKAKNIDSSLWLSYPLSISYAFDWVELRSVLNLFSTGFPVGENYYFITKKFSVINMQSSKNNKKIVRRVQKTKFMDQKKYMVRLQGEFLIPKNPLLFKGNNKK